MPEKWIEVEGEKYYVTWFDVLSSNITRIGSSRTKPETPRHMSNLFIEYNGNRIYMYKNAGYYVNQARDALSTGAYIQRNIKGKFECVKVVRSF